MILHKHILRLIIMYSICISSSIRPMWPKWDKHTFICGGLFIVSALAGGFASRLYDSGKNLKEENEQLKTKAKQYDEIESFVQEYNKKAGPDSLLACIMKPLSGREQPNLAIQVRTAYDVLAKNSSISSVRSKNTDNVLLCSPVEYPNEL